jgi:hypothetical protein
MDIIPPPRRHRAHATTPVEVKSLHVAVTNRALIDQAKGVLIMRYRIEADAALHLLRGWADEFGVSTLTVAQTIIQGLCQGHPKPTDDPRLLDQLADALGIPPPRPPVRPAPFLRRLH